MQKTHKQFRNGIWQQKDLIKKESPPERLLIDDILYFVKKSNLFPGFMGIHIPQEIQIDISTLDALNINVPSWSKIRAGIWVIIDNHFQKKHQMGDPVLASKEMSVKWAS